MVGIDFQPFQKVPLGLTAISAMAGNCAKLVIKRGIAGGVGERVRKSASCLFVQAKVTVGHAKLEVGIDRAGPDDYGLLEVFSGEFHLLGKQVLIFVFERLPV